MPRNQLEKTQQNQSFNC